MNVLSAERLVFSGGGLRGIAYLGALLAIRDRLNVEICDLPNLKQVSGCSIGSFVALLICMKFTVLEMQSFMHNLNLSKMFEISYESIVSTFAMNDASVLTQMVVDALAVKGLSPTTTFFDLKKKYVLDLLVGATDLTDAKFELLSYKNYPSMPIVTAVVASMSLPPVFPPQKFNMKLLSDGGLMNSFPIALFPVENTLGFKLAWYVDAASPKENILTYYTRVLQCLQVPMETSTASYKVFHIDVGNFSAFRVDSSSIHENVVRMMLNGYRQVNLQLDSETQVVPDPCKFLRSA